MKILDIYDIYDLDYNLKDGLMRYEATGKVKSEKYFPIYGDFIFKPLSKTKPLTTPLFAYSEVFWSYFINKYFEEDAPRYYLARCSNIENELPKYYELGTLVEKVTSDKQKLVNLLEYFNTHSEEGIDISNYTNYCEKLYNYVSILDAPIFEKREDLRNKLETQILLSILKQDENFHYENVSFIVEDDNIIDLCPTLDSEFSSFFLYSDNIVKRESRKEVLNGCLNIPFSLSKNNPTERIIALIGFEVMISLNNIYSIMRKDKDVIISFVDKLTLMIEEIESTDILFINNDFFETLNSDAWKIGTLRFKDNNESGARELEESLDWYYLDSTSFNNRLKSECLDWFKNLKFNMEILLYLYSNKDFVDDKVLKYPTLEVVFNMMGIDIDREQYESLSIDDKLKLIKYPEKQKVMV